MEEHTLSQRALAETLGTALLVLVGPGSVVATLVLAGDKVPAIDGSDLLGISFAFGLVITALVYAIGKVSGCHINPAVTFALASTKRFPWKEVPTYMGAQLVGGTLGALGIWALFTQTGVDMGLGQASFNEDTYTWGSAIFAEFIGTAHPHVRDPRDRRLPLAGRLRRHRDRRRRGRDHHGARPDHGRVAQPGPRNRPGAGGHIRRRRHALEPDHPGVHRAGVAGATVAAFAYDFLATPRTVKQPIESAVTHPDPVEALAAK